MMLSSLNVSSDEERDYLIDMVRQLAKLAHSTGEVEAEIMLRAILDIMRARAQRLADGRRTEAAGRYAARAPGA